MSAIVFLGIAVGVSLLGSLVVALRHRQPRNRYHAVDDFSARMQALAPPDDTHGRRS